MTARWLFPAGLLGFCALWLLLYPAEPWPVDGDVYDHLSATRNLLRGEGLSGDVIYPLTTAWQWGRQLPQPMLHRPPGFSLLLTVPFLISGKDTQLLPGAVRMLQVVLLLGIAAAGLRGLNRRQAGSAGPAWLLLLLLNPLLALAVNWGWSEVACALLLLALWLRLRPSGPSGLRVADSLVTGLLAGFLTLLRTDLIWVPVFWWLALIFCPAGDRRWRATQAGVSCLVWLAITLPWWVHVTRTAGAPWFNPLSYALQLDLSENWWEYPRLRGLSPEPALVNLRNDFIPALVKVRHGVRFYLETLGDWLPWLVWGAAVVLAGDFWRRRRREAWPQILPLAVLATTLGGLILWYGLLSQEVRHLLVLLPILAWEAVLLGANAAKKSSLSRARQALLLTAAVGLATVILPLRPEGEMAEVAAARLQSAQAEFLAGEVAGWPPGPVFTDNAAVCWLSDRQGVWRPYDAAVEAELRLTMQGLQAAPWVRLHPSSTFSAD